MNAGEPLSELVWRAFDRRTPRDMPAHRIDTEPERKGSNCGFAE
jgi:hypothetical protein